MIDPFGSYGTGKTSPVNNHASVTPSDAEDLPVRPRALYILTDGNLAVRMNGVNIVYPVFAGQVMPVRAERVLATDTTATCVAWW